MGLSLGVRGSPPRRGAGCFTETLSRLLGKALRASSFSSVCAVRVGAVTTPLPPSRICPGAHEYGATQAPARKESSPAGSGWFGPARSRQAAAGAVRLPDLGAHGAS